MRYFLAIDILNEIKEECIELTKTLQNTSLKAKFVEKDNLHVTLKFLGDIKSDEIECIKENVKKLNLHAFTISLSGIGVFPNKDKPRVLWIGIDNGNDKLTHICKSLGGKDPHLTIARIKSFGPGFVEWLKKHENDEFGYMKIEEIILFESTLSEAGPKYTKIWSYDL